MREQLKRELNKTYLIFDSAGEFYEESYELEMLVRNSLKTMLPLRVMQMDEDYQLYYEVTSRQNLKECTGRVKLSFQVLCTLFETIDHLMKEIKDFLLEIECVQFDLEHIYTKEGAFYFCYCPWNRKEGLQSIRELLEEILSVLDYNDTDGVALAYHFYQSVCKGNFQIKEILKEHREKKAADTQELNEEIYFPEHEELQEPFVFEEPLKKEETEKKRGFWHRFVQFFLKKKPEEETQETEREVPSDFEVLERQEFTEVLEMPQGETTLLENMRFRCWELYPLVDGYEEFRVSGDQFLVGKKRDAVDGYIGRETISRIHSRLFVRNERLYVQDANSTNGTFVNGIQLQPGEEVEILSGDRILFADVGYECYNSL